MRYSGPVLITGMIAGLAMALWDLVDAGPASGHLPDNIVAMVGDQPLTANHYDMAVSLVAADKTGPLSEHEQQLVLDRLIDEELLIRHGLDMGYIQQDRSLRKAIARQVIANVVAESDARQPDTESLRRFFAENKERFRQPGVIQVQAVRISTTGTETILPLPETLTPAASIYRQLGQQVAAAIMAAEIGETRTILLAGGSRIKATLLARQPGKLPGFSNIQPQIETEYVKQARDKALGDLLTRLRRDYEIRVRPGLVLQDGPNS